MIKLDYRATEADIYVARDCTGLLLGTWPATGRNAPRDPRRTIADTLATYPGILARQPIRVRRERHIVCLDTGALLTDCD